MHRYHDLCGYCIPLPKPLSFLLLLHILFGTQSVSFLVQFLENFFPQNLKPVFYGNLSEILAVSKINIVLIFSSLKLRMAVL